jgi:Ca2+-binding EF-hand superfamily protein
MRILNRPGGFREAGDPDEYCRGFQVFDKDMTGFIGVGQLRYILTNLGEKFSDEEVDELLKAVDTSRGEICYTGRLRQRRSFQAVLTNRGRPGPNNLEQLGECD